MLEYARLWLLMWVWLATRFRPTHRLWFAQLEWRIGYNRFIRAYHWRPPFTDPDFPYSPEDLLPAGYRWDS